MALTPSTQSRFASATGPRQPYRATRTQAEEEFHNGALNCPEVPGEQSRIHRRQLRFLQSSRQVEDRASAATGAGLEPFQPSAEWFLGFVEDPRFLRGRAPTLAGGLALALTAVANWTFAQRGQPGIISGAAMSLLLLVSFFVVFSWLLDLLCERQIQRATARLPRSRNEGEVLLFNAPMPASAVAAYGRARALDLFDNFVVCSPQREDFRTITSNDSPSLGLLDPVLIGLIAQHSFLIAQWDLGVELADASGEFRRAPVLLKK